MNANRLRREAGFSMIEVLVSLTIVVFGLLGLVGLQAQAQIAEFESYQRGQALLILNDMVERIAFNRAADASGIVVGWKCYIVTADAATGTPTLGTGYSGPTVCFDPALLALAGPPATRAADDLTEWDLMLKGAAETSAAGNKVGGLLGARGCISADTTTGAITISVAWQGMSSSFAPTNTCGKGAGTTYGANDGMRRVVSTQVIVPVLTGVKL